MWMRSSSNRAWHEKSCCLNRASAAHLRCNCILEVAISAAASLPAALTAPALAAAAAASSALSCMLSWPHCRDASSRSSYASCKAAKNNVHLLV